MLKNQAFVQALKMLQNVSNKKFSSKGSEGEKVLIEERDREEQTRVKDKDRMPDVEMWRIEAVLPR